MNGANRELLPNWGKSMPPALLSQDYLAIILRELTLVHVQNGQHLKSALNLSSAFKTQHKLWLEMLKKY